MSNDDARQPAELSQFLERYPDTRQLELLQPDMLGILRGKRVGRRVARMPLRSVSAMRLALPSRSRTPWARVLRRMRRRRRALLHR